jgi:hypothetical protein
MLIRTFQYTALCLAAAACGRDGERTDSISHLPEAGDVNVSDSPVSETDGTALTDATDATDTGPPDTCSGDACPNSCEHPSKQECTRPQDITAEITCNGEGGTNCVWPLPEDLVGRTNRMNLDRYRCGDDASRLLLPVSGPGECEAARGGWYVLTESGVPSLGICSDTWKEIVASGDRLFVLRGCS